MVCSTILHCTAQHVLGAVSRASIRDDHVPYFTRTHYYHVVVHTSSARSKPWLLRLVPLRVRSVIILFLLTRSYQGTWWFTVEKNDRLSVGFVVGLSNNRPTEMPTLERIQTTGHMLVSTVDSCSNSLVIWRGTVWEGIQIEESYHIHAQSAHKSLPQNGIWNNTPERIIWRVHRSIHISAQSASGASLSYLISTLIWRKWTVQEITNVHIVRPTFKLVVDYDVI